MEAQNNNTTQNKITKDKTTKTINKKLSDYRFVAKAYGAWYSVTTRKSLLATLAYSFWNTAIFVGILMSFPEYWLVIYIMFFVTIIGENILIYKIFREKFLWSFKWRWWEDVRDQLTKVE